MKTVAEKPWLYTLYEDGERLILSVLSGGVGLFDVPIVLSQAEADTYRREGIEGLAGLIDDMNQHPAKYQARMIKLAHP